MLATRTCRRLATALALLLVYLVATPGCSAEVTPRTDMVARGTA